MKVIGVEKLETLKDKGDPVKSQVLSWEQEMRGGQWKDPYALRQVYPKVSTVGGGNTIFNIMGNKYRIWVKIDYQNKILLIKKSGTHDDYSRWKII